MSNHPLNLTLRFALEIAGLFAFALWGWTQHGGVLRYYLAIAAPLAAAILWGVFRAEEPIGPKKPPVTIPGWLRLALEFAFFGLAVWAFYASDRPTWGLVFALLILLHYLVSYDRVVRLTR